MTGSDKLLLLAVLPPLLLAEPAEARVSILLDDFEATEMTPESTSGNNSATVLWQDLDLRWSGRNKDGDTADWQIVAGPDGRQLRCFDSDNKNTQCGAAFRVSLAGGSNWALEFDAPLGANWNDIDIYLGRDDGDNLATDKIMDAAPANGTLYGDTISGEWLHLIDNGWDSAEGSNGTITYVIDDQNHVTIDFDAEGNLPTDLPAYDLLVIRLQMPDQNTGNLAFDNFALSYEAPFRLAIDHVGGGLTFSWNSRLGKVYDLLKAEDPAAVASAWSPWVLDIEADPPVNMETYPLPAGEPRAFFKVAERDAPALFFDDFETVPDPGWTTGGTPGDPPGTSWERGTPAGFSGWPGPFSGENVFTTNVDGDYTLNAEVWLRSPAIDLTDPAYTQATLTFHQFRDIESGFDFGYVRVLDAADESVQLGEDLFFGVSGHSSEWEVMSADLPVEALGKSVKIEFFFDSDEELTYAGWHIDDVSVRAQ